MHEAPPALLPLVGALIALMGCLGTTSVEPTERDLRGNQGPLPALRVPVVTPIGVPVRLDASATEDPEGEALSYVFEITGVDAVHTTASAIEFTFSSPGLYTVRVRVSDPLGAHAVATQDITVRDDYPDPADFCVALEDCAVGDECVDGVCYVNGGAVEF